MKINIEAKKVEEVLTRGVEQVLPSREALKKLMEKRRIRLYLGVDPTAPKLHLGHTVTLRKLQEFAGLGHEAILVIGTGTVLAGDPSLRLKTRPLMSEKEVKKNIQTWKRQAGKILNFSKVKIKYNGDWLLKLKLKDIIKIASQISAVKLFQREMFQRRIKMGQTVWAHETLYPLLQGYDSVFLNVDLEIGGTDQTFNMLIGRELMGKMRNKEKFVLTCPMILGIDGRPMSKTSGNCIWIEDTPSQMFGKIMSIPDDLIFDYFKLLTRTSLAEIEKIKKLNPRDAKAALAQEIVRIYHGKKAAEAAEKEFERVFKERKLPSRIRGIEIKEEKLNILEFLVKTKLASSKSEAKRLILQKGVKIDGKIEENWRGTVQIKKGMIIQVGKRKFVRLV
ncbi:tyrosine--tRNA ligase [bacterium]|uniref:Tyrosine--tRNA ligase n=4 Tax=Candidatus Nealsoniibacteriota TaxID=1817911 RepID=A0A2M7EBU2_9BACT|nr:tyrosine--tRNA ligase [bacterium]PIV65198.1 MAG: tyrosine--tRNA ligase [Candidatus Nealsonbacteria bacterium CG01_land_8_20_14_3_00_12]PIW91618.1 MAG: tyrosine--tRNA ligase [Candidatus Nealsonbacteria bacterium CG_4_8_14_3_um_filter_37_36]PJA83003.1 MAG: tyrosine--tRNA ligase [Candidatus Nealsonbacteria bacterium CG_4_9_14_3_um_filter_37_29]